MKLQLLQAMYQQFFNSGHCFERTFCHNPILSVTTVLNQQLSGAVSKGRQNPVFCGIVRYLTVNVIMLNCDNKGTLEKSEITNTSYVTTASHRNLNV